MNEINFLGKVLTLIQILTVYSSDSPQFWADKYGDILYQYALPRVNDVLEAEDLVQDTFLSALKALPAFKGDSSVKNWLFAILKNKIIDHYRKKTKSVNEASLSEIDDVSDWFNEEGSWNLNKKPLNWDHNSIDIESKELSAILNDCKNRLKTLTQQVYVLKYLEDVEATEICKVLNISTSNYWILLHRARLQMRDCIENKWIKQ